MDIMKACAMPIREDVRCLCHRCLQDYLATNRYIVKRLDPLQVVKDTCVKCNRTGFDYILIRK